MKTFSIPSFEIWNKTEFSCRNITEAPEGMLLFLMYLSKLSARYPGTIPITETEWRIFVSVIECIYWPWIYGMTEI